MIFSKKVTEYAQTLKKTREYLHSIPEESFKEYKTSEYVKNFLSQIKGISHIESLAGTGVKAVVDIGAPKTFAVRADMDALEICEQTGLLFASKHKGFMHACGHDGHMAVALSFARLVCDNIAQAKTNFVFIFQPGEETTGGALPMIKEGVLENPKVDKIFGFHFWPTVKKGMLAAKSGAQMANMWDANFEIKGKAAHGSSPKDGIDALYAGAKFAAAAKEEMSGEENCVFTIGKFYSGSARNIISESTVIESTLRSFDDEQALRIKKRLLEMLKETDKNYGTKSECKTLVNYPAVINDENLLAELFKTFSEDEVYTAEPVLASEDFSRYGKYVPALHVFAGVDAAPLHSATFTLQDDDLLCGLEYYYRMCFCGKL